MAPLSSSHVTAHFSRSEMRYDSTPAIYRPNLEALAVLLERVRLAVGAPLAVNSTYRTAERNAELPGASSSSQHLTASAADFRPVGITVATFLERLAAARFPLGTSQLIVYPLGSDHVHLGLPLPNKPAETVLLQTSLIASRPRWQAAALGDSLEVYQELRRRRGRVSLLVVVALLVVGAVLLSSHT